MIFAHGQFGLCPLELFALLGFVGPLWFWLRGKVNFWRKKT